jgi:hypothetical protein
VQLWLKQHVVIFTMIHCSAPVQSLHVASSPYQPTCGAPPPGCSPGTNHHAVGSQPAAEQQQHMTFNEMTFQAATSTCTSSSPGDLAEPALMHLNIVPTHTDLAYCPNIHLPCLLSQRTLTLPIVPTHTYLAQPDQPGVCTEQSCWYMIMYRNDRNSPPVIPVHDHVPTALLSTDMTQCLHPQFNPEP